MADDQEIPLDEHAVLDNAKRLADAVLANCDDWSEGRAYAYALRNSLRVYLSRNRGQTLE